MSYPQFFCFLIYGKVRKVNKTENILRIEKLYIADYLNPIKMFSSLITYFSKLLEIKINYLEFITNKANYF